MSYLDNLIERHLKLFKSEKPSQYLSLDTETTGLELLHGCKPFFVSTCTSRGKTKCWEWPVDPHTRQPKIPRKDRNELADYISDRILVFHNACFDIRALETIGIQLYFKQDNFLSSPPSLDIPIYAKAECISFHDTQVMSHPVRTSDPRKLKLLSILHLDYSDTDEKILKDKVVKAARTVRAKANQEKYKGWKLGLDVKGKRQTEYDYWLPKAIDPSDTSLSDYAANDAERTILLLLHYLDCFKSSEYRKSLKCYMREKLLLPTVFRKESIGISLKRSSILTVQHELETSAKKHKYRAKRIGSTTLHNSNFNPDSYDDNKELLYEKFKLPIIKKTEKGQPSTNKETLGDLLLHCKSYKSRKYVKEVLLTRIYQSLLRYLKSYTYYMINTSHRGYYKLHTSINQVGTSTTRYATSRPNQQNVSMREKKEIAGREIEILSLRSLFSPPPGKVWYTIDYSQLELRIYAVIANDKKLKEAFLRGEDIHNFVAANMFPDREIGKELRIIAKAVAFGIVYGKLRKNTDLAAGFPGAYDLFVEKFPTLPSLKKKLMKQAREVGYVETLFDYPLDIPPNRIPTTVINYVCQGTAGDIIKNATIAIDHKGIVDWKHSAILLQVHDELVIEVDESPKYNNASFLRSIIQEMEGAGAELGVYTPVEVKLIDTNWARGKKVKVTKNRIKVVA